MTREEREEALDVLTDMANALHLIPTTRQGKVFKMALQELQKPEPCGDSISRQAVIEVLNKMDRYVADELTLCDTERKFPKNEVFIVDDVYEEIVEQLPPVTPAEKVGKWIDEGLYAEGHSEHAYRCSKCNEYYIGYVGEYKYCPNCGAKMREGEDNG